LKGELIVQIPMDVVRNRTSRYLLYYCRAELHGGKYFLGADYSKVLLLPLQRREQFRIGHRRKAIGVFGINSGQAFAGVIGLL
jgi:ACR3 family arsenite transporter